jgi:hypothetical protein
LDPIHQGLNDVYKNNTCIMQGDNWGVAAFGCSEKGKVVMMIVWKGGVVMIVWKGLIVSGGDHSHCAS